MPEQQQNNDVIQSPIDDIGGNDVIDLSPVNEQLGEIINIIKTELEEKKKKEQEQLKLEEENKKTLEVESATQEEKEVLFFEGYDKIVTSLENIQVQNTELINLNKMSFIGLGVFIALMCVLIFQNAFKK